MSQLAIAHEQEQGIAVIDVDGELDMASVDRVAAALSSAVGEGHGAGLVNAAEHSPALAVCAPVDTGPGDGSGYGTGVGIPA